MWPRLTRVLIGAVQGATSGVRQTGQSSETRPFITITAAIIDNVICNKEPSSRAGDWRTFDRLLESISGLVAAAIIDNVICNKEPSFDKASASRAGDWRTAARFACSRLNNWYSGSYPTRWLARRQYCAAIIDR